MLDDDKPIGRILTRREVLALFGAASATLLIACDSDDTATPSPAVTQPSGTASSTPTSEATSTASSSATTSPVASTSTATIAVPACVVRPELTEGPYFVDEMLNRSDIRSDPSTGNLSTGVPLALTFRVYSVGTGNCIPLAGAQVDVWHCDAQGVYSDVTDPGFNTAGKKFLRGYQMTGDDGAAVFQTIYPGWYQGRTVHIHFKIRDGSAEFTSQLFFDDALSDNVFALEPYASKGTRETRNDNDNIFGESEGLLTLAPETIEEGYAATFDIGLESL